VLGRCSCRCCTLVNVHDTNLALHQLCAALRASCCNTSTKQRLLSVFLAWVSQSSDNPCRWGCCPRHRTCSWTPAASRLHPTPVSASCPSFALQPMW
jgi:hypothetical protein